MKKAIQRINDTIAELKKEKERILGRQIWKCPVCNRGTQLKNLNLIIMEFYVSPHGCTGGDYWTPGKEPEYKIHCPKCDYDIREVKSNGCGVGYNTKGIFSKKRWKLIHKNHKAFKAVGYECKR